MIVAQAMLKDVDRLAINEKFKEVLFIRVSCDEQLAFDRVEGRLKQSSNKPAKLVTVEYAKKITRAYKDKNHHLAAEKYPFIINDGEDVNLVPQINKLIEDYRRLSNKKRALDLLNFHSSIVAKKQQIDYFDGGVVQNFR